MPDQLSSELNCHKEAEELLPWYVTGQLDPDERLVVDAHLASCAHCRRQLSFERSMVDEFSALTPSIDSGWARLRQRIDSPRSWRERAGRELAAAWTMLARPSVAALAAVQLVFVEIAGSVLLSLNRRSYRGLGTEAAPQSANVLAMFRPDTTESQMRALLKGSGATLVGGPTQADAYLLRVAPKSREGAVRRLRADRHVLMAQPIDGDRS